MTQKFGISTKNYKETSTNTNNLKKINFRALFGPIIPNFCKTRPFFKNSTQSVFQTYCSLTSCKKSKKSIERFPRTITKRVSGPNLVPVYGPPVRGQGVGLWKKLANMSKDEPFHCLKIKTDCDLLYCSSSTTYFKKGAFFPILALFGP